MGLRCESEQALIYGQWGTVAKPSGHASNNKLQFISSIKLRIGIIPLAGTTWNMVAVS